MNARDVARHFHVSASAVGWLEGLADLAPSPSVIPDVDPLPSLLSRLAVPAEDVDAIVRLRSEAERDEARWLRDRCRQLLVDSMGRDDQLEPWVKLSGPLGPYFYAYVYLSVLSDVREFHSFRGVPESVSWATLGDFGASMAQHRAHYGVGGLHWKHWLTKAFRGFLYRLGRLEFEMRPFPFDDPSGAVAPGEWSLSIHIPPSGQLTSESCESALRWAASFFPNHFPEHEWTHAYCTSWLLDPALAEYLPSRSNIVQFQKRFSLLNEITAGDAAVLKFVFNIPEDRCRQVKLDDLPQQTTLQRAIVSRLRSGGHWRVATGWVELS